MIREAADLPVLLMAAIPWTGTISPDKPATEETPVFDRALAASRRILRSFGRARPPLSCPIRPCLEELEVRALLSAATGLADSVAQTNLTATPLASSGTTYYYTPQQVRQAYGFTLARLPNGQPATGAGQTIAIIDAYHDPNIQSDLHNFDGSLGLPDPVMWINSMNGVSQVSPGWASETALDVEWAHAAAPQANILLVEAASSNYSDLLAAVQYASSLPDVVAVSMSWGGSEFSTETSMDSTFTTPSGHIGGSHLPGGITYVVSSGDTGAGRGAQWPAVSPNVLSVGGTSLVLSTGYYGAEGGWSGSGGGYSNYEAEPSFQYSAQSSGRRTSPDVAYDANPNTGVLVYNTVGLQPGQSGWWIDGGTSAGAPQWAGIFALVDQARGVYGLGSLGAGQKAIYNLSGTDLHDITTGFNGYSAGIGYDLVTGRGTPNVNRIVTDLATVPSSQAASIASPARVNGRGIGHAVAAGLPGGANATRDNFAATAVQSAAAGIWPGMNQGPGGNEWLLSLDLAGVATHPPTAPVQGPSAIERPEASHKGQAAADLGVLYFLEKDRSSNELAVTTELARHFVTEDSGKEATEADASDEE
jgi:hypothetical protein